MNDWDAYALWLGQEHRQRLWRELVGNSMVVLSRFLLHCERQTKPELWDFEYANDEVGDLMEEIWSSGAVAPTQVAGVREAHAPERDAELAESCTHDADGEFAEIDIDDGYQPILPRQPLPCNREPRDMIRSPGLDKEEIKLLAISWSNICVVCKVNGKEPRNHHHWTKCDSVQGGQEKMTDALAFLRGIPFAKFVHCNFCYRPQAICEIWNRSLNNRGLVAFNKTPGAQCSFGMGVWEAAAAFLAFGQIDNLEEWRRDGDLVAKQQQLGKKYKRGELEFSGLFVYFYKWA
ncbi:uncharacterized protein CPUR_08753 [Claviceps purpurea 20.1]|uniref:Uncharacterized protein n=1 Tax=Claviceps purpurea (strain 20.1) TaxID=1111077 RepID=M1WIP0_CLAP2|nr:uncharacterized protein CPUR_08753 [Claviceps purpurea 20.1]